MMNIYSTDKLTPFFVGTYNFFKCCDIFLVAALENFQVGLRYDSSTDSTIARVTNNSQADMLKDVG